jgi:multicomponent Na+:H+ antiporter subunit D
VQRLTLPAHGLMLGAAALLALQVSRSGPQRHALGGWAAPLGIELYADGLSALLILMSAGVGGLVAVYARHYFAGESGQSGQSDPSAMAAFWPLWWFLWAALDAVFLAADVFNVYVTLELLGLAAVGLVVLGRSAEALAAGLRYLLVALFGSLMYLLGVAFLYGSHGSLAFTELAARVAPGPLTALVLGLTAFGLALKSALFPLHLWLPPAHGGAETPVSALLSALVVKASFYLLLRLWFDVYGAAAPVALAQGLGVLGAVAIFWGATEAFLQRRLKMLVAYSTVAQVGYLFLVFPLATGTPAVAAALGWQGGVYHALSHAFAKAAMFLAAGTIVRALGKDDIEHLEGTATRMPWSVFAFGLAGITLIGLPPSGGFIAKWLLLSSALASGQWWWVVVLLGGGLLTAAYVFRVLRSAFVPPLPGSLARPVPGAMQYAAFTLALVALVLGLVAPLPFELLAVGAPFELAAGSGDVPVPDAPALGGADDAPQLLEDFAPSEAAP